MRSLESRPERSLTERLSAQFAAELLSSSQPPLGIGVSTPYEREQRHIDGTLSIPLNHLMKNLEGLPKDRTLLVYCAGGYRSSIAASLLQCSGFDPVSEIAGGIAASEAAKLPIQSRSSLERNGRALTTRLP